MQRAPWLRSSSERQRPHELADVVDALGGIALERLRAVDLEEGAELAHYAASSLSVSAVKKPPPPVETGWSSRSISRSASARL